MSTVLNLLVGLLMLGLVALLVARAPDEPRMGCSDHDILVIDKTARFRTAMTVPVCR